MLIPSHMMVADHVYDHIKENYGVSLAYSSLIYGSVLPDMREKAEGAHYGEACLDSIADLLMAMENDNPFDLRLFSRRMGELLHYAADYFTAAHNKGYLRRNMRLHMIYETKLHFALQKINKKLAVVRTATDTEPLAYLRWLHDRYEDERCTIGTDLNYIMVASVALSLSVMSLYYSKQQREAA